MRPNATALAAFCAAAWWIGATAASGQDSRRPPGFKTDQPEGSQEWDPSDVQVRADSRYAENCRRAFGRDCGAEIYYGTFAAGLYPNVALIIDDWTTKPPDKRDVCSGTLIASRVVLTAAHCVDDGVREFVAFGDGASTESQVELDANARPFVRTQPGTAQEGRLTFIKVANHASMTKYAATFGAALDIGLILLESDAPANAVLAGVAATDQINASPSLTAVGFGLTQKNEAGLKHHVDVIVGSHACNGSVTAGRLRNSDRLWYGCLSDHELVAGGLAKRSQTADTCLGDSGGPLFVKRGSEFLLAAVTSRGVSRRGMNSGEVLCGDGGIYTRADGVASKWINHVLEKEWQVR